ncbi:MAG: DUF1501 domain-containing protein [Acidobacteria bacterium]|nr:DUF1501 domain-containing protein [Acidobacteriota bacterium]
MQCAGQSLASSRRDFLARFSFGFGGMALGHLQAARTPPNPLAPKRPHFPAKAKSIIYLFMQGGPSHVDTFDPKPMLQRFDGQSVPASFNSEGLSLQNLRVSEAKLMGSRRTFKKYGQSGLDVSDLFGNTASAHADDIAVVRSVHHEAFIHGPALNLLYSGSIRTGFPSAGSWVVYGLGSECDNLPAFIMMSDGAIGGRSRNSYSSGFLPALYQGTVLRTEGAPLVNLSPPPGMTAEDQRAVLDQLGNWNRLHLQGREDDSRLEAQIANYELAFRMQTAAPALVDTSSEPEHIRKLYGLDEKPTEKFGRLALLARRLVERGVRFVQLVSTDWDGHGECDKNHTSNARKIDQPIAALITDLKQRGLLESTLIVSVGEFGRTPVMQGKEGRDHHPYAFSAWLCGGGVKGGKAIGSTDDFGFRAVGDPVHVNDLHGAMLSLMGLDHLRLTYPFNGRDFRLTDVGGTFNFADRLRA